MSRINLGLGTLHQYTPSGADLEASINLNKLSDVTITAPLVNNQILRYNTSTSKWENVTTGEVTSLEDLSDVTITAITNGQVIAWNTATSLWENTDVAVESVNGQTGVVSLALHDLNNVVQPTVPSDGQSLQWNGGASRWEAADIVATVVDGGTY